MRYHFISEEEQISCNNTCFDILLLKHTAVRSNHRSCSQLYLMRLQHRCFSVKLAKFLGHLLNICQRLLLCSMVPWCCSLQMPHQKEQNPNLTFFSLLRNRKIALCEEHFEKSCFNKSVDFGRRLMNSRD